MKYTLGLVALLSALLLSFDTAQAGVFTGTDPYDVTIKTTTNSAVVSIKVVADAYGYTLSICKGDQNNRYECISPATKINISNGTGTKTFTYNNLTPGTLYTLFVQGGNKGYYEFSTDKAFTSAGTGSLSFQSVSNALIGKAIVAAQDKNTTYYVFYYPDLASADNINGAKIIDKIAAKPGATWQFTSTVPVNDFYYGRLVGKDDAGKHTFLSGPVETVLFYARKLEFKTSGDKATATGYINTSKHTNFRDFTATIYVSKNTILTATGNEQADAFYTTANQSGIAEDGSYKITISNLDENTLYYFRHVITSPAGTRDALADSFNSTRGYVPEGSIEKGDDFDNRSYHLLAPFPGLTAVLDPDLCREQQKEGKVGAGQVCGINEFINLMLKLLVGITAVLLVIRIIIEGYNYVVTDVPFLKVSAKTHIFESTFGLILALTSFLILNTVNPKLVSSDISIRQESLTIVDYPDTGDTTIDPDFKKGTATYSKDASLSQGVKDAVAELQKGGKITAMRVFTNDRMSIVVSTSSGNKTFLVDIAHGMGGFATSDQAKTGDRKTPIGSWKIIDVRKPAAPGQPVFNKKGSNMGAAFFHLSPTVSGERGIGIHGNKNGTLSATLGCIRLKNADIEALLPYVKAGIPVYIGN
jgi:hypothetical protein